MHKQNFIKIHSLFLKIEILTSIKGYNSVEKFPKISSTSHNTAVTKFHQFVLKILNGNWILTSIKGHNSVKNWPKLMCIRNNMNLGFINAYTKFYQFENSSIWSEDIEKKNNL